MTGSGIRGVVFSDFGNVWNTESQYCTTTPAPQFPSVVQPCFDAGKLLKVRTSAGFGVRVIHSGVWGFASSPFVTEAEIRGTCNRLLVAGVNVITNENELAVLATNRPATPFVPERDFRPLSFSANGSFEGEVVFAGYGLSIADGAGKGYNSYDGLDVSNKSAR